MATLIEEFELRIKVAGGRYRLAETIEDEWNSFNHHRNPLRMDKWLEHDDEIVLKEIEALAKRLSRTIAAVGSRAYCLAYKKALAK